jgi:diguanylate cyclase (GGDEF)-like protein/PAS domain S-box-containing protein
MTSQKPSPRNKAALVTAQDITGRKWAKDALAASEAELRALFASMQDVVMVIDREGVYRKIAPTNPRLLVTPPEELLGKNLTDVFPAEKADAFRGIMQQVLDTKQNTHIEYELNIGGQSVWFQTTISPLNADSTLWVAHDITRRKQVEKALAEEQHQMQTLMNHLPANVYFKDRASRFIRISKFLALSFDLSDPAQAIGKTDFDFFTEEHARQAYEDEQAIIQTGQTLIKEEKETWANHPDAWVSTTKLPIRDNEGNIIGTFGISTDITERKRAEEALQTAEANYRSIFENATVGIYQSTPQGRFLSVNPLMARIFGYDSPEEMLTSTASIEGQYYVDPADRQKFQCLITEQGEVREFISLNKCKDDRLIWVQENARAVKDAKGSVLHYEGFITDITERVQAEHDLGERVKELRAFYGLAEITEREGITLDKLYQELADILPNSWQYPEITCARIVMGDSEFRTENFAKSAWMQSAPVKVNGAGVGRLEVGYLEQKPKENEGPFVKEERLLIDAIAERVGRITERKWAEEELRRAKDELETANLELQQSLEREKLLACTDGLTGLCNRRHFFELADREFHAAVRYRRPLAFLMFDMDNFKQVNDTLGHAAGDKLLALVAQTTAAQMRASDVVSRYGGDEFIFMLSHTSAGQALIVAERIRASVAALRMDALQDDKGPLGITLSIGIAGMRLAPLDENVERVIQRADEAMYAAKQAGRNRTVIFGQDETGAT